MNRSARRTLDRVAGTLIAAYEQAGPFPGQEVTPPLLADDLRQCFAQCQAIAAADAPPLPAELDELGTHALECLADLALWTYPLQQDAARNALEDLALELTLWLARQGGQPAVLEAAVNALARQADATQEASQLAALHDQARELIGQAGAAAAAAEPWRMLHVNAVIIAARSGDPVRLAWACDALEAHLPGLCAAFYAEAVRAVQKPAYGDAVRTLLGTRLATWTP